MKTVLFILLLAILAEAILLYKTINALPLSELRRRARANRFGQDQKLYKLAAYHSSLPIFIWLVGGLSGGFLIVWLGRANWSLATLFILLVTWVIFSNRFRVKPGGFFWRLARLTAAPATFALSFFHPIISSITKHFKMPQDETTGLYETEDLLQLLDKQAWQADNRINERELKIVKGALGFIHKTVRQVMTPASEVRWLSQGEVISPKLMDELHKTGFSRFPVVKGSVKSASPEVLGSLYIKDLLNNLDKNGSVAELMVGGTYYIEESHTLYQALDAFLKSNRHLLVVVNNFEEIAGVLTLEDVLEQILGAKVVTDFEHYHSKHTVAGHEPGLDKVDADHKKSVKSE